jgi:hypothetical protein
MSVRPVCTVQKNSPGSKKESYSFPYSILVGTKWLRSGFDLHLWRKVFWIAVPSINWADFFFN